MQHKTYKAYSDSGHSWIAVKRNYLKSLGVLDKITCFSYQRGETIYLEEDYDAGLFIESFSRVYGHKPKIVEGSYSDNSPIRYYRSFQIQY